jgi:hypothetical protein
MSEGQMPRIAVVGSNMANLVTHVDRMPVKGETVEAPSFENGTRRQESQSGGGRRQAGRLGGSLQRCG